jgi:excisionase family DNA binding protein
MEGVTLIETAALQDLIGSIERMELIVTSTVAELKKSKNPYLTTADVTELTGFGPKWVQDNKAAIGFSMIGNHCRFKRSDVEEFMEQNYFKSKKRK